MKNFLSSRFSFTVIITPFWSFGRDSLCMCSKLKSPFFFFYLIIENSLFLLQNDRKLFSKMSWKFTLVLTDPDPGPSGTERMMICDKKLFLTNFLHYPASLQFSSPISHHHPPPPPFLPSVPFFSFLFLCFFPWQQDRCCPSDPTQQTAEKMPRLPLSPSPLLSSPLLSSPLLSSPLSISPSPLNLPFIWKLPAFPRQQEKRRREAQWELRNRFNSLPGALKNHLETFGMRWFVWLAFKTFFFWQWFSLKCVDYNPQTIVYIPLY